MCINVWYFAGGGGGGGGNDTPRLRVPAARIFKELPCFGVKFSNIHPASESGFLPGIFSGDGEKSIVFKPVFFFGGGGGGIAWGKASSQANNVS